MAPRRRVLGVFLSLMVGVTLARRKARLRTLRTKVGDVPPLFSPVHTNTRRQRRRDDRKEFSRRDQVWLDSMAPSGQAVTFDPADALRHLRFCQMALCTRDRLEGWNCGRMCRQSGIVPRQYRLLGPGRNLEARGFVAKEALAFGEGGEQQLLRGGTANADANANASSCVVVFRGTLGLTNWFANIETWMVDWPLPTADGGPSDPFLSGICPGCRVHRGFAEAYADLQPEMLRALQELRCQEVRVVGHSLGAALAHLATMELRATTDYHVRPSYLFGSPRIGNRAFVQAFADVARSRNVHPPAWRIVHYRDPVPKLPPEFANLEFAHGPPEVFYTEGEDAFRICNTTADFGGRNECSDSTNILTCLVDYHTTYFNMTFKFFDLPRACTGMRVSKAEVYG